MRALKTITFVYEPREDRIAAVINAGGAEAWSCWLTRRLALAVLKRMPDYLSKSSELAQRVPAPLRPEIASFERQSAIAATERAMSYGPPPVPKSSVAQPELAERLTITPQGERVRLELHGQSGEAAVGALTRAELQRIVHMLEGVVVQAGWVAAPAPAPAAAPADTAPKSVRH